MHCLSLDNQTYKTLLWFVNVKTEISVNIAPLWRSVPENINYVQSLSRSHRFRLDKILIY